MIETVNGNIFDSGAEALVNPVNCWGVMGTGLAGEFYKRFPENFAVYQEACRQGEMQPGKLLTVEIQWYKSPRYIINFPTKRHWSDESRLEDIDAGLKHLKEIIRERNITSIAIPALGCGLGGLEWREVEPRIRKALESLEDVRIFVFRPHTNGVSRNFQRYLMGI